MQRILASRSPFPTYIYAAPYPNDADNSHFNAFFHRFLKEIHFGTISVYKILAETPQRTAHNSPR